MVGAPEQCDRLIGGGRLTISWQFSSDSRAHAILTALCRYTALLRPPYGGSPYFNPFTVHCIPILVYFKYYVPEMGLQSYKG